jgi:hypothetical protein
MGKAIINEQSFNQQSECAEARKSCRMQAYAAAARVLVPQNKPIVDWKIDD